MSITDEYECPGCGTTMLYSDYDPFSVSDVVSDDGEEVWLCDGCLSERRDEVIGS